MFCARWRKEARVVVLCINIIFKGESVYWNINTKSVVSGSAVVVCTVVEHLNAREFELVIAAIA